MDSVRFGKALGVGAREAAKALLKAADAASSPNPQTSGRPAGQASAPSSGGPANQAPRAGRLVRTATEAALKSAGQVRSAGGGVRREGRRFGEAVWGPTARLTGVLWLEVTGVFFGLFALTAAIEVWKHRESLRGSGSAQQHVWLAVAMLAVFGYFTVSSFVKASRRGRP